MSPATPYELIGKEDGVKNLASAFYESMDELEEAGIVGPANGSKPREILATIENLEDMFGD